MPDEEDEVDLENWWEETWNERHEAFLEAFGDTGSPDLPQGWVHTFTLMFPEGCVPGACAMPFAPRYPRDHWLYVSHGLSQPLDPGEVAAARREGSGRSGHGFEYAIVTDRPAPWAPILLRELMAYTVLEQPVEPGDTFHATFYRHADGSVGIQDPANPVAPFGTTTRFVFAPYRSPHGRIVTSTGWFDILVGTAMTEEEYGFVREAGSPHFLLLLERLGIGQRSDLSRPSVTADPRCAGAWASIRGLDRDAAIAALERVGSGS